MKKTIAIIIAVIMILSFAACGTKQEEKTPESEEMTLQALYEKNFERRATGLIRGKLKSLYEAADGSAYYVFSAPCPFDTEIAFDKLDIFEDNYEEDMKNLLLSLEGASVENITDKIPSAEELKGFVGKTLGEMQAAGFEECGSLFSDNTVIFGYTNGIYECALGVDPATGSEEETSSYVIKTAEYDGLSASVIDEPFDLDEMLARVENEGSIKAFYDNLFGAVTTEAEEVIDKIRFNNTIDGVNYYFDVIPEFTDADKAEYAKIQAMPQESDEEWEERFNAYRKFLCSLKLKEVKNITDLVPSQEELDVYLGKTPADMEKDGFKRIDLGVDPLFYYENDQYKCLVMLDENGLISYIAFADII